MKIENNILKHYLKNVYFITGTAYAGKSTTVKMLAERYDMVFCGENYFTAVSNQVATPDIQPDLCYIKSLTDWKDFVTRSPEEYERWIYGTGKEAAGFEVAELLSLSRDRKVIVDTNIPLEVLREISDYHHVAVMLSPQSMSVDRFFDRSDPEKQFLLSVIESCENPEAVMENYNVDDKEAQRVICKIDRERAEYYEYHTGNSWNDDLNYDISLNTARVSWEKCVKLIKEYIKIKFEE